MTTQQILDPEISVSSGGDPPGGGATSSDSEQPRPHRRSGLFRRIWQGVKKFGAWIGQRTGQVASGAGYYTWTATKWAGRVLERIGLLIGNSLLAAGEVVWLVAAGVLLLAAVALFAVLCLLYFVGYLLVKFVVAVGAEIGKVFQPDRVRRSAGRVRDTADDVSARSVSIFDRIKDAFNGVMEFVGREDYVPAETDEEPVRPFSTDESLETVDQWLSEGHRISDFRRHLVEVKQQIDMSREADEALFYSGRELFLEDLRAGNNGVIFIDQVAHAAWAFHSKNYKEGAKLTLYNKHRTDIPIKLKVMREGFYAERADFQRFFREGGEIQLGFFAAADRDYDFDEARPNRKEQESEHPDVTADKS